MRENRKFWLRWSILFVAIMLVFTGCSSANSIQEGTAEDTKLEVHFMYVGQGDSILIKSDNHAMLIDAGEYSQRDVVASYLKKENVEHLDYVIGTHPHSDHIGAMGAVIREIAVDKIILPPVAHTTNTFEELLDVIEEKNMKITKPVVGTTFELGDATVTIIAPNKDSYHDLNDYSIGIKVTVGETSFILAGDAEALSEREMMENGIDLSADVLKLNHHGSKYSNCDEFLDVVSPDYAIISVGKENDYGHPDDEVLERLEKRGISGYRTDQCGTIKITSDGKSIKIYADNKVDLSKEQQGNREEPKEQEKQSDVSTDQSEEKEHIVYRTKTGTKYHEDGCRHLKTSKVALTLDEAKKLGLEPCAICGSDR